LKNKRVMN